MNARQILRDLIISILAILLYGSITGGLFSGYIFHLGDPALIGGMIKHHAEKWKTLEFDFSEQPFFYPYKNATYYTENFIGQGLLFSPLSNCSVVLISHLTYWLAQFLSLFAMIQLIRAWTRRTSIPYFVSILWVFNPARALGYSGTQGNFQNIWDFPVLLSMFALTRWFQTQKMLWALAALLFFWMQFFFSAVYPAFAGLVILFVFTIGVFLSPNLKEKRLPIIIWSVISIVGYWMILTPYREVGKLFGSLPNLEQIQSYSNTISSTFSLPTNSALGEVLRSSRMRIVDARSSYPGFLLVLGFLCSFRDVRSSLTTRWAIVLALLLWGITLGPVIQWSDKKALFENSIWLWAIEKFPSFGSIRVPYRFVIGLHWVLAWQVALFWDRSRIVLSVENRKLLCFLGLPALLSLLFLTDLKVRFLTTDSQQLGEPVHNRIAPASVVLELPTGFGSPVRFRTVALAVERHFKTVDGQAAFLTPLAGYAQFISQISLTKRDIDLFRSIGLTSVVLHCHDFEKTETTKEHCKKNEDTLTQSGFEIVYSDHSDILFQDTKKIQLAMIYESIDLNLFNMTVKNDEKGNRLVLKPRQPVFVAFPQRCYPLKVKLLPTGKVGSFCYRARLPIAERRSYDLPENVQAVQILKSPGINQKDLLLRKRDIRRIDSP